MQRALRDGRTVLTHDLDFANLLAASGAGLPSVVIFRLRNMRPERVLDRLRAVVAGSELKLAGGVIAVVTESHIRLRHLPLEGS
jgi:predicted nuclease of predicted toxin-antitoxin system